MEFYKKKTKKQIQNKQKTTLPTTSMTKETKANNSIDFDAIVDQRSDLQRKRKAGKIRLLHTSFYLLI